MIRNPFERVEHVPPKETREEVLERARKAQREAAAKAIERRGQEGTVDLTEELKAAGGEHSDPQAELARVAEEIKGMPEDAFEETTGR